jgi:hypothetical protein
MGCLRLLGNTNPPMVMASARLKCHPKKCAGFAVYGVRNARYETIRQTMLSTPGVTDLRTAAFVSMINKIAISYMELGIFP